MSSYLFLFIGPFIWLSFAENQLNLLKQIVLVFFFIFQFETFSFFVSCLFETTSGNLSNRIIEKLERVSFLKKDTSHHITTTTTKKWNKKWVLTQKTSNKINVIVKAVLFRWMSAKCNDSDYQPVLVFRI